MNRISAKLFIAAALVSAACVVAAAPIKQGQGVIAQVGEGFLLLKPDGQSQLQKFLLRWKARFVPPKLPLKGDRVLILYKEKEEGLVVYGLKYLNVPVEASGNMKEEHSDTTHPDGGSD